LSVIHCLRLKGLRIAIVLFIVLDNVKAGYTLILQPTVYTG
jgi:hypothetical protein